jgi:hypothetical protein
MNENVLVKAEFDISDVDHYTFQFLGMRSTWPVRLLYWMINILAFGFVPFALVALVFYGDLSEDWSTILWLLGYPVFYLLYLGYYRFVRYRKMFDPEKNNAVPHETFLFYSDHFVNTTVSSHENSEVIHHYAGCTRAYETKKYFYIFITKTSGFTIRKSAITMGSVDDLRALLKTAFPKKFHKR